MQNQIGKIGTIHRELHGEACSFCGGHTYQLVLRADMESETGRLFARCAQCRHPHGLDEGLGRILWM